MSTTKKRGIASREVRQFELEVPDWKGGPSEILTLTEWGNGEGWELNVSLGGSDSQRVEISNDALVELIRLIRESQL